MGRQGTRIEVRPGYAVDCDDPFEWAELARALAFKGEEYKGKTSPWWYDSGSFRSFAMASSGRFVRDFISQFDGCSGGKAGEIAAEFKGRSIDKLNADELDRLLGEARRRARPVKPQRLGKVGALPDLGHYSGAMCGTFSISAGMGRFDADVPFVAEVWAQVSDDPDLTVCVNRTPITSRVGLSRGEGDDRHTYTIWGCNLCHRFQVGKKHFSIKINIITPRLPLMNDGKSPDLRPVWRTLRQAIEKAVGRAKRQGEARARRSSRR